MTERNAPIETVAGWFLEEVQKYFPNTFASDSREGKYGFDIVSIDSSEDSRLWIKITATFLKKNSLPRLLIITIAEARPEHIDDEVLYSESLYAEDGVKEIPSEDLKAILSEAHDAAVEYLRKKDAGELNGS